MLWGNGHRGAVQNDAARFAEFTGKWSASNAPQYAIGFNEPDCSTPESSDLPVDDAVWAWDQWLAPLGAAGTVLVSPSMCSQLHENFLTPFTQKISMPYDIVAVHIYKPDVTQVKAVLDYFWIKYQKPMWVTEFGCVDDNPNFSPSWDAGRNAQFMRDAVGVFQNDDRVKAYTPANAGGAWIVYDGSGKLTDLGRVYLDAVSKYA